MDTAGFIITPFFRSPASSAFMPALSPVNPQFATKSRTLQVSQRSGMPARMCTEAASNGADDEDDSMMQGPSQAPTKAGISTAGLGEEEAKFIEACYDADVVTIESMIESGIGVGTTDVNRRTALHFCAGNGLPTVCRKLIAAGSDLNAQDMLGLTPLHMAAGYKKLDTVRILVEAGADSNIQSFDGQLPVEIAEAIFEKTPEKKFFIANQEYAKLKEIVEILDEATEVEEESDEEEEEAESLVASTVDETNETTEETDSAKFVVRVKPKGGETPPPPTRPTAEDVKVTIRVKEPESK